jgi:chemotaxis methyl-accepting protein methylase
MPQALQFLVLTVAAWLNRHQEDLVWSAGCASGEEPLSVSLLWRSDLAAGFPDLALLIVATDVDLHLLARARRARFAGSSLREVPEAWRRRFFRAVDGEHELDPELLPDAGRPTGAEQLHDRLAIPLLEGTKGPRG